MQKFSTLLGYTINTALIPGSCKPGTVYNSTVGYCIPCSSGFYETDGTCLQCPDTSARDNKIGAASFQECGSKGLFNNCANISEGYQ
ncbi:MAG: hypothetical protein GY696_09330 [Gammaproteobacteria bacterium]|nr:hypothetical protein [Gammaproteobacteria bacterium]